MNIISPSRYYHIYNHSNGKVNIMQENENYIFFMGRYKKYISPIANTYAWCLMPNHFHLLVQIKEEDEVLKVLKKKVKNLEDFVHKVNSNIKAKNLQDLRQLNRDELDKLASNFIILQFQSMFISYTKSYHKFYNTRGNLFYQNFKRKQVDNEEYLMWLILYIHNNPVHHGFTKEIKEWPYSSYNCYLNSDHNILNPHALEEWFVNKDNFIYMHSVESNLNGDITLE